MAARDHAKASVSIVPRATPNLQPPLAVQIQCGSPTIAGSGLDTPGDEEEEMPEHDYDLDPNLAFPRVNWGRLGSTFGELLQSCGYSQEVLNEYKHVRDVKVRSVSL